MVPVVVAEVEEEEEVPAMPRKEALEARMCGYQETAQCQ